jgi:SAM-dependent methyltransferase
MGSTGLDPDSLTDHARLNRESWNAESTQYQDDHGAQLAASGGLAWGVWQIAESELRVLGDVRDRDVLELGCGAAQWSIALAALGARPVGLDVSEVQLEHARRLMDRSGVDFPLVHASAESVPLDDEGFDVVFCDYGATTFADPHLWVPEAARLLRSGGLLAFSGATPLIQMCYPDDSDHPGDRLLRDYFGMRALPYEGYVDFMLPYGEWIALFRANGFEILDLIELRPAEDAKSSYRDDSDREWSRRWPAEQIWRVRKQAATDRP